MKKCRFCGKVFSHSVYPLHLKRCKEKPQPEAVSAPVDPQDPPADNNNEPTGNTDGTENTTPDGTGNNNEPTAPVEPDGQEETKAYSEMSEQELRVLAKDRGIAAYHNKGLDKIIAELEEMDASQE